MCTENTCHWIHALTHHAFLRARLIETRAYDRGLAMVTYTCSGSYGEDESGNGEARERNVTTCP